jgi:xanthine/CO dehydrogenase XdhC/CoxF family maturation factor
MKELLQILDTLAAAPPGGAVLATLVKVDGSSYRRPGARLLLTGAGQRVGSISGGCLEDDVLAHARDVLASGMPRTIAYDTAAENDLMWGVGVGCPGVVHVLIEKLASPPAWVHVLRRNLSHRKSTDLAVVWQESAGAPLGTYPARDLPPLPASAVFRQTITPPVALVVFGAGDDTQPLVRFAKELGWHVTVADPRPAFATSARFPGADSVVIARPEEIAARVALGPDTLVVVMTHHYAHDLPLLRELLLRPLAYLGLLGSRKRTEKILSDLAASGVPLTAEICARLHAPVGLDLGADTPEEVALAVLAEMLSVLRGRDARPLRERTAPIHG